MRVNLIINGEQVAVHVEQGEYLLDTLRKHNYLSVKRGCEQTSCGVCTVLLEGNPVPSCSILTIRLEGAKLTTVEGIPLEAARLARHFGEEGADQCGFCNPAMALTVYSLKQKNPHPTDQEIKDYLIGNLCRCTGYQAQHIAIRRYLEEQS
ncbi:MAG: 2Fe-2S iron-sulfur cluster-binding protein [Bacillus subtilis]|nr:2Fe-2S iron-sulfur cluster-binding protein [Bacillus subtilis]